MKHARKITLTSMLLSSVLLTGCFFQEVPSSEGKPSVSAPTKTLSSSEIKEFEEKLPEDNKLGTEKFEAPEEEGHKEAKETLNVTDEENEAFLKELSAKPLGIDVSKIEIPEIVEKNYPAETFDVREGARVGLAFYEAIAHEEGMYEARDASKDWGKFFAPYESQMLSSFKDDLKKAADSKKLAMNNMFLVANTEGILFEHTEKEAITPAMMPVQEYSEPVLGVGYLDDYDTDFMHVQGNKLMSFKATNGKMYYVQIQYTVRVTNLHDDTWVVSGVNTIPTDVQVM